MYTIMIVEDELLARLALKNTVEWEKYNVHEVIEAKDGLEALEKFKQKRPDIMIVDINIPFLNGIELMKEIRKTNAQVKFIILSCMADFEYAREAIKAGVSQYILKASMSIEEIESAIKLAIDEIQQTQKRNRNKESSIEEFQERKTLLRRLINGEQIEGVEETAFKASFVIGVVRVEFKNIQEILPQELLSRMNFIKNIITSAFEGEYTCYVIDMPRQQYMVYIEQKNTKKIFGLDEIKQLFENVVQLIQKYTSAEVFAGISDIETAPSLIHESFQSAKKRLGYLDFLKDAVCIGKDEEILRTLPSVWEESIGKFTEELSDLGMKGAEEIVQHWPPYTMNYLAEIQNFWIRILNRIAVEWEIQKQQNLGELTRIYTERIQVCKNLAESITLFQEYLNGVKNYQSEKCIYSEVVQKAIQYALEHYEKPVTLNDAAEYIPVSSNHLSMIFRKEYGMNYTDFIIELRLKKAKTLLETSNYKLFEIAEMCGFNDHAYFTRTFKKHFHISPYDYRKKSRQQR